MQQYLPLAVLKHFAEYQSTFLNFRRVATVLTVYGIETMIIVVVPRGNLNMLRQYLPLAVCDEGCEAAEEQSDDEVRTSLVPDQREGKTEVIKQ